MVGIAPRLRRRLDVEGILPEVGGDGFDLVVFEAEGGHLRAGAERLRIFQPDWHPLLADLGLDLFEVGADFFDVLHQELGLAVELGDARVDGADGLADVGEDLVDFEVGGVRRQAAGAVFPAVLLQIIDRQLTEVLISSEDRDNFIKNMLTVRAEERVALAVKMPSALVYGEFA